MPSLVSPDIVAGPTPATILFGSVLTATFFGLTILQNRRFYEGHWNQSLRLKLFVVFIGALNTAQMITVMDCDWWRLINYHRTSNRESGTLSSSVGNLALGVGLTVSIVLAVQSFFALRIWIVCRNNGRLALSLAALGFLQLGKTLCFLHYLKAACNELARTFET